MTRVQKLFVLLTLNMPLVGQGHPSPPPPPPPTSALIGGVKGGVVGGTVGRTVAGEGKTLEFGLTPTLQEQEEMQAIATDLYPQLLYYFQSTSTVTHQIYDNGRIKISNGFQVYEDPYLLGHKPKIRIQTNLEGPSPGCYLLRAQLAMNDWDAPISRTQVFEQYIFGKWYYAKVRIPQKRFDVWFDFISAAENSLQVQTEIRNIIQKVIAKRIPS